MFCIDDSKDADVPVETGEASDLPAKITAALEKVSPEIKQQALGWMTSKGYASVEDIPAASAAALLSRLEDQS
jgi:hypothetical protein